MLHRSCSSAAVLEQGKCINCGISLRLGSGDGSPGIFGFVDRGFDTRVKPYFELLSQKLATDLCDRYAEACPTGAIVKRSDLGAHVCFAHPLAGLTKESPCGQGLPACARLPETTLGSARERRPGSVGQGNDHQVAK